MARRKNSSGDTTNNFRKNVHRFMRWLTPWQHSSGMCIRNSQRDQVLAQEASSKEIVESLSLHRTELKALLQQLYAADQQVEASV